MRYNFDQTLDQFLKDKQKVTDVQIAEIAKVHAIEGGGWAGHFVDAGIITETDLVKIIIEESQILYLPLISVNIEDELVEEFTIEFLQTFECCPIEKLGPTITIATPNPFQPELIRSRTSKIGHVELFLCRVGEWREVMRKIMEKSIQKSIMAKKEKARKR